jgi:hypothetical protein
LLPSGFTPVWITKLFTNPFPLFYYYQILNFRFWVLIWGLKQKKLESLFPHLSKKVHPRVKKEDGYTSLSQSDADIPLVTLIRIGQLHPSPREGGLSDGKQLQALTKIKREPIGGPKSGRTGPVAVSQQKRKSPMQPFARSPLNTKGRPKTPFDGRHKWEKYGSIQERVGGFCTRDDSSYDEREESNSPDGSSGAKMKGNDEYSLGD